MKLLSLRIECLMIFCLSLLAFTYGLFDRELIGFETRLGVFAQEMLRYGPHFFPTTYKLPYPDYPALQTFLIYLLSLPMGKLSILCAALPSAIASAITLAFIYLLLIKHDRTWAYAAVLISLLTYQFLDAARSVTMDSLVMMTTIWAFYCAQSTRKINWGLWLALVLGFAIRGPIGLVLPASAAGVALWSQYKFTSAWRFGLKALTLLACLMVGLLLIAKKEGGMPFVADVLRMQIFGRMNDHEQQHQFFDYFTESFANYALSFELALLTALLFITPIFRANTPSLRLLRQCCLWVLVIMIGMSIPNVRKIRYIMPITPALAILASYWWYQTQADIKKIRVVTGISYFFLALPLICLALITLLHVISHHKNLAIHAHYLPAYLILSLLALTSLIILFRRPTTFSLAHPLRVMLIGLASFWAILVFIITPINVSLNRAKPFTEQLLSRLPADKKLVFFQTNADGVAIVFMLAANPSTPPEFVRKIDWQKNQNDYWFLTTRKNFDKTNNAFKNHVVIIQTGKLGHQPMVVFRIKPSNQ